METVEGIVEKNRVRQFQVLNSRAFSHLKTHAVSGISTVVHSDQVTVDHRFREQSNRLNGGSILLKIDNDPVAGGRQVSVIRVVHTFGDCVSCDVESGRAVIQGFQQNPGATILLEYVAITWSVGTNVDAVADVLKCRQSRLVCRSKRQSSALPKAI